MLYIRHILALLLLKRVMYNLMKAIDESYAYITFFGRFIASFLPDHKLTYSENYAIFFIYDMALDQAI